MYVVCQIEGVEQFIQKYNRVSRSFYNADSWLSRVETGMRAYNMSLQHRRKTKVFAAWNWIKNKYVNISILSKLIQNVSK
jgi:hypothetical protein